ncbi:MAG: hypothetical protein JEY94_14060 [Melioribacteraceae bacterium]|nr:hypothetical protein [Melioribacteraceae bacterium]
MKIKSIFIAAGLLLLITSCSGSKIINSGFNNLKIDIDGNRNDWKDKIYYQEDGNYGLGVTNNDKFLNLIFITSDRSTINKIVRMGFTVWFEAENGSDKFGLRFPINELPDKNMIHDFNLKKSKDNDQPEFINNALSHKNEFLIINEKEFPLYSYPVHNNIGIDLCMQYTTGQLIYELKIPTTNNNNVPFVLDASSGEIVEIGFETTEIEKSENGAGMKMGGDQGGRGRGMGKQGGGRRGGGDKIGGTNNQDMKSQFEHSVRIKL